MRTHRNQWSMVILGAFVAALVIAQPNEADIDPRATRPAQNHVVQSRSSATSERRVFMVALDSLPPDAEHQLESFVKSLRDRPQDSSRSTGDAHASTRRR